MANDNLQPIPVDALARTCGGRDQTPNQQELRDLARQHCPRTYQRYRNAPQITRPQAEECLDEAGLSAFRSRLDRYFPPQRR
jgi:hypothetical protein